jgi:hypothetical protein
LTAEFIKLHQRADTAALRRRERAPARTVFAGAKIVGRGQPAERRSSGGITLNTSSLCSRPRRARIVGATRKASTGEASAWSISCVRHCAARRQSVLSAPAIERIGDDMALSRWRPSRLPALRTTSRRPCVRIAKAMPGAPYAREYCNAFKRLKAPQPAAVPAYSARTRIADTKQRSQTALPPRGYPGACDEGGYSPCPGQRDLSFE